MAAPLPTLRGAELDAQLAEQRLAEADSADARLAAVLTLAAGEEELGQIHPDELFGPVRRRVEDEQGLGPSLRALPTARRLQIGAGVVLASGALMLLFAARPDLSVYPPLRFGLTLTVLAGVGFEALRFALHPLHEPALPAARLRFLLVFGLVALLAVQAAPTAHVAHHASLARPGQEAVLRAATCFGIGTAMALPLLWLFGLLDRGGLSGGVRALLAAVAAGFAANVLLQLHCPATAPAHLLFGHALVAFAVVLGALVLRR